MRIASLARTLVINIIKSAPLHICQTWKPKGQCLTQTKQDLVKQPENTYIFCFVLFCFVALTKHTRGVSSIYKKKLKKTCFKFLGLVCYVVSMCSLKSHYSCIKLWPVCLRGVTPFWADRYLFA